MTGLITVEGTESTIARFVGIAAKAEVAAVVGTAAGADAIADIAREKVPVLTGALKDSIHLESSVVDGQPVTDVVAGDEEVDYAVFVEFGPDHEPFLRPAADQAHAQAIAAVDAAIKGVIR